MMRGCSFGVTVPADELGASNAMAMTVPATTPSFRAINPVTVPAISRQAVTVPDDASIWGDCPRLSILGVTVPPFTAFAIAGTVTAFKRTRINGGDSHRYYKDVQICPEFQTAGTVTAFKGLG